MSQADNLWKTFRELHPELAGEFSVSEISEMLKVTAREPEIMLIDYSSNMLQATNNSFDLKKIVAEMKQLSSSYDKIVISKEDLYENDTWRKHHSYNRW